MGTNSLTVRTELIEALRQEQQWQWQKVQQQQQPASGSASTSLSVVERFLRACPPLADPAWAMEELQRASGRAETWSGSALPATVWAPPGTPECPFKTVPADFTRVNSSALSDEEATEKEVEVQNPAALLSSLRAKAAVAFRLHVSGFSLVYKGNRSGVSLTDERQTLQSAGLQDGDTILLLSKRVREANGCVSADDTGSGSSGGVTARPSPGAPATTVAASITASEAEGGSAPKALRIEQSKLGTITKTADSDRDANNSGYGSDGDFANASEDGDVDSSDGSDGDSDGDGAVDIDLGAASLAALLGTSADAGAAELYGRLIEVVPDLVALRQQFLADPKAVMERIQRDDPTLFQLITAHQEAFVSLINNEDVINTMQAEREGGFDDGDEEFDEEAIANLLGILAEGSGVEEDEEGGEDDGEGEQGGPGLHFTSDAGEPSTERILAYAPSEQDEEKIQQLTQLGFPYNVCKVAFYLSLRSLERAANRLFENPPQL